tara:strand:- start:6584 stop:7378 length:795 start_codon:yes stop_codon:yes gene_type:complete
MIETNCEGCVFSELDNGTQCGCTLNRIEKLGVSKRAGTDGLKYTVLSRFCNAFRPVEWVKRLSYEEATNPVETVNTEIKPRIGFLIYLDTSKPSAIQLLEETLKDIKNQTDNVARYVIVATEKVEYSQEVLELLLSYFDQDETTTHVLQLLIQHEDKMRIIDEAFRLALNGWLYVTTSGQNIDINLLKNIDNHINKQMKRLSVVLPYDGINGLLFQCSLFKYVNGNGVKQWDENNMDHRPFLEKVKDLDTNNNSILDWSDIDAS